MADSIWTADDVATLKAAVLSGVLQVSYNGPPARSVTYNSLAEMRKLLAEVVAAVNDAAGTRQPFRFAAHSKGFDS